MTLTLTKIILVNDIDINKNYTVNEIDNNKNNLR